MNSTSSITQEFTTARIAEVEGPQATPPEAAHLSLESNCKLLALICQKTSFRELDCTDILTVLYYMEERGYLPSAQRLTMKALENTLLTAQLKTESGDIELSQRLGNCAKVARAFIDEVADARMPPDGPGKVLTKDEIYLLLAEANSAQTELLMPGAAQGILWFLAIAFSYGLPIDQLYETKLSDVVIDKRGLALTTASQRGNAGQCRWQISLVMGALGFLSYVECLKQQGVQLLFPQLATDDGRGAVSRFLAGRRIEHAGGRKGGYSLNDIRVTGAKNVQRSTKNRSVKKTATCEALCTLGMELGFRI